MGIDVVNDIDHVVGSKEIIGVHVEVLVRFSAAVQEQQRARSLRVDHVDECQRVSRGDKAVMVHILGHRVVVPLERRLKVDGDLAGGGQKAVRNDVLEGRLPLEVSIGRKGNQLVIAKAHRSIGRIADEGDRQWVAVRIGIVGQ